MENIKSVYNISKPFAETVRAELKKQFTGGIYTAYDREKDELLIEFKHDGKIIYKCTFRYACDIMKMSGGAKLVTDKAMESFKAALMKKYIWGGEADAKTAYSLKD